MAQRTNSTSTNASFGRKTNIKEQNNDKRTENVKKLPPDDVNRRRSSTFEGSEKLSAWDKHNFVVKALLLFMFRIVSLGHRGKLNLKDIRIPPNADRSNRLASKLKVNYELELMKKENPSLTVALFKTFWPNISVSFFFDLIAKCLLAPMQIIALGWIIRDSHLLARHYETSHLHTAPQMSAAKDFFGDLMQKQQETSKINKLNGGHSDVSVEAITSPIAEIQERIVIDAILLLCLAFLVNFFDHLYFLSNARVDMKYRIACGKLVYQKALRLSKVSLAGTTAGQMVNLLSNDVNRFEECTKTLSNLITSPAQTIIVLIILPLKYLDLKSTMAGLATVVVYMLMQTGIGRGFSRLRLLTARRTDRRVLLINEIIVAIRVIKMYAWEEPFKRLVQMARRRELNMIGLTFILRATNHTLFLVASKVVVFALLITYVLTGHSLNGEVVFVTLGMGNLIRTSLTFHFPNAIAAFAGALVSCRRLNEFLLLPEVDNDDADQDDAKYKIKPQMPTRSSSNAMMASFRSRRASSSTSMMTNRDVAQATQQLASSGPGQLADGNFLTVPSEKSAIAMAGGGADPGGNAALSSIQGPPTVILFNRVKTGWSLVGANGRGRGKSDSEPAFRQLARSSLMGNKQFTLPTLSLSVKSKELIMVVGRVGSGKTSLLLTILGELPIQSGRLQISTSKLAYAPQESWIFPGTVRENILLGKTFKATRYDQVVEVCCLKRDFSILLDGDLTFVGDRGVSLSGGQRARVNLARALYHEADIYVLDDPLSAVDAPVAKHIFAKAIRCFLRNKTVILATHQLQFLRHADKVLVLEREHSALFGTVDQLRQSEKFKEINFARQAFDEAHLEGVRNQAATAASVAAAAAAAAAAIKSASAEEEEQLAAVESIATHHDSQLTDSGELEISPSVCNMQLTPKLLPKRSLVVASPVAVSPNLGTSVAAPGVPASSANKPNQKNSRIVTETSDTLGSNWSAYVYYLMNSSNWIALVWFVVVNIIAQVNLQYVDYFLSLWTHSIQRHEFEGNRFQPASYIDNLDNHQIAIWYGAVIGLCLLVSYIRTGTFYLGALIGSSNIHRRLFNSFIQAPTSFYDFKPIGILLNRVSRDIGYVDEMLPNMMLETISSMFFFCGILGVTIFIDLRNALGSLMLIAMALMVRYFMARTIIRLKQLEGMARSPVFSHLSISLNGLSVIRVFKIEEQFCAKFDANQDDHSGVWFYYTCAGRFMSLAIDVFTFIFIASIIYTQIFLWFDPMNASFIGLTLTQVINLPLPIRRCMKTLIELDSYMTSVQRIKEFSDVSSEEHQQKQHQDQSSSSSEDIVALGSSKKSKKQVARYSSKKSHEISMYGSLKPIQRGRIKFKDVSLKYLADEPPVLRNLTFSIEPGENIGIVGRTGAGKSSIMAALFRLYPFEGTIELDGHDIKQMSLRQLRSSVSIIPQEPVLFGGSLRKNLDPFGEYSDFELWASLEAVRLDSIFSSSPHGLEYEIQEFGANLSVGQRQLICLARAILRRNKILVLDEATANVDMETDAFIQQTIKQQFAGCTVLTIAHRLLTIVNSDRVLVLDAGQVKEFDDPFLLVTQQPPTLFREIVRSSQGEHGDKIIQIIKEVHERRNVPLTKIGRRF